MPHAQPSGPPPPAHPPRVAARFPAPLRVAAVLAVGFLIVTTCTLLGWTQSLDRQVLQTLRRAIPELTPGESHLSIELMRDATALGGIGLVATASVLLIVYLALRRAWRSIGQVVLVVGGAQASVSLLKLLIARPRPDLVDHGAQVITYSYPSGHATLAAAVALSLAWAGAARHRRLTLKVYFWVLGLLMLLLLGFSRMYLGVHWVSDVAGGLLLGSIFACLGAALNQRARRSARA